MTPDYLLPPSVRVTHGHVASTGASPPNPTWVGWRWTTAGAHLIVISARWRHGSPSPSARRHSVKTTVSTAGPSATHWEPSHKPAAAPPLFEHNGETPIFIGFIIEVWVIGLCTTLNGGLKMGE